jgi:O-acetyl-ADP-ribose deacetylase (regulator of RNase III)
LHRLFINGVSVGVSEQPIETLVQAQRVDALVSSDDTHLSMGGGVSRAIRLAAGEQIVEEARALTPLSVGQVVVTSAGGLPARYVFHAVTVDWDRGVRPSEDTIRLVAERVFRRCEMLGVHRLSMPALGMGAAKFSAEYSARLIVAALAEHLAYQTILRSVIFSLPDGVARAAFLQYLQTVERDTRGEGAYGMSPELATAPTAPINLDSRTRTEEPPPRSAPTSPLRTPRFARRLIGFLTRSERSNQSVPTRTYRSLQSPVRDDRRTTGPLESAGSRPLVSNRYVLLEELGRGGMGVVYLAWDTVLRQTIAIKTLHAKDRSAVAQGEALKREAALQIRLVHEGIVRVLNFEPADRFVGPYIIMEYLPWASGDQWIAEVGLSGLPVRSVLAVGIRLCDALEYAHAANVLHGDIKPSNVFVEPTGDRAKLADFGIARVIGSRDRNALVTRLVGTPDYMAPEQRAFGAKVTPKTDIYLLGRTLAEFVGARTRGDVLDFPDIPALRPTTTVLRRALDVEPENRPLNAHEFGRMLGGALTAT